VLWCLALWLVLNCIISHQCGAHSRCHLGYVFVVHLPCWAPVLL